MLGQRGEICACPTSKVQEKLRGHVASQSFRCSSFTHGTLRKAALVKPIGPVKQTGL